MKINIKGIVRDRDTNVIRESVDYYDKILNILDKPYFKNLETIGIPEYQYETIFSKLYNQPIRKYGDYLYNKKRQIIYYENSDGYWVKYEYDNNGKLIYHENSNGEIIDHRNNNNLNESVGNDQYYDKLLSILQPPYFKNLESIGISEDHWDDILSKLYNQPIRRKGDYLYNKKRETVYFENSYGEWYKSEYDSNGNEIYYEDSTGYWEKSEYDENGNQIYYEDSNGDIIDKRNNNNLNESVDYYDKLLNILEVPYYQNLETMGIPEDQYETIFSKLYNKSIRKDDGYLYDSNGKDLYYENSDGYWVKYEYDNNGKLIYRENSNGDWSKKEYDNNGKLIYRENSYGDWSKSEYDSNGNKIYFETSEYGIVFDRRNNNNLNESIDDKYYDKLLNILEVPYYQNLETMGISEDHWDDIFSKLYNQPVRKDREYLYNSNGNQIYYETSYGYWTKSEYDSNDNQLYFENSQGYWKKYEYDENGNIIYREDSDGYWIKREYDSNGNEIYYEDSNGKIRGKRNNNLNESIDYYDKILDLKYPPYYQYLRSMGIPKKQWETIFSKLYNQPVRKDREYIYDSNGKELYFEDSIGEWEEYVYDDNGRLIYKEDCDGNRSKSEYDSNGNLIYREEFPSGYWFKSEYDSNGNKTYYETSKGYWRKQEYDEYGNEIYFEDSYGKIRDKRNNNNINESTDDRYYDKIVSILQPPYFKNLETIGIPEDHWETVFSKLYNQPVRKDREYLFDSNGNEIYYENSNGEWKKSEYNDNGYRIYYEDYDGYWYKYEYDENGNEIYFENSYGEWEKREYDENGRLVYYEDSYGMWSKYEYDSNGNEIYYEDSDGYWYKKEYDDNGYRIYSEDSDGKIIDKRNNNLNESTDDRYYNKIVNILQPPYFKNLETIGIPEDQWNNVFSKLYNQPIRRKGDYLYNSNGNQIYYETSYGYWTKYEYDNNGNEIYFENSDGEWKKSEYDNNGNEIYFEDSYGEKRVY